MVTAKRERQVSALNNGRHVLAHALVDGRDRARAVHFPDIRIRLGVRARHVAYLLDRLLAEHNVPAQRAELVQQPGLDERFGALIDACAWLAPGEGVA